MEFVDRVPTYKNRYTMTNENGSESLVYLERADEPVVEGTPLNADTFNNLLLCSESKDYPSCYYHVVDGETEWLNPPMMENTYYRTVKRFNGYPVYRVAAVFPTLAAKGSFVEKQLPGVPISKVLSISTTYYPKDGYPLSVVCDPFMDSDGLHARAGMSLFGTSAIRINTYSDLASDCYSAVCVVEFTKSEEAL